MLSKEERLVLDFESATTLTGEKKNAKVLAQLGINSSRYYQTLNWLLDSPEALILEPQLIHRLQRIRQVRYGAGAGSDAIRSS